ncbi:MAG: DUF2382 domain-containing protein [Myxococcaceae bacterium]
MRTREDIKKGMKVHGSDGKDLGKVVAFGDDTFMIEKGFFFPKDYYCRYDEIADIREGDIWLSRSSADLKGDLGHEELRAGYEETPASTRLDEEYRVPLAEEELEIRKRPVVKEGVRVRKTARTDEARMTAEIEGEGDLKRREENLEEEEKKNL